jgi:hypothetical protein
MPTSALSLPIDVPWKRLAISQDMYAPSIDSDLPEKWRSSLAVFVYEPDPDPTDTSGEVTTFLKLVTSITGYNSDAVVVIKKPGTSIGIPLDLGTTYYPALCALAQIAVFPDSGRWDATQFPYFTDFQPKQREVIETKTATGEIVSQTSEPLNVYKSTTTTEGQLDFSSSSSKTGQVNETTFTDASRERRETTSYSTNLSQLYQLLDSYHSGTNRAVFLTVARPHLIDSPYTFVNGPRRLEGVQEFLLVVRRPQEMGGICVKAVLETAHLDPTDSSGDPATLFTTARTVSGCTGAGGPHILPAGPWVTFEKQLPASVNNLFNASAQSGADAVVAANAVSRAVRDMFVASFRQGMRYSPGSVDFLHTNFAMRKVLHGIPTEVLHTQRQLLESVQKIETTLATPGTQLSKEDFAARTQLLAAIGVLQSPKA